MELELGLKITKNLDDICTDFRIAKDRGGIIFVSNETETMFILTSHLRGLFLGNEGYRMENIKIDINEDATLITISGEKPKQEMVMKGLMMHKKKIEIKRFTKVFRIPRGVILDRIKAKFNEIDSTLAIYMPKLNNGIIGGVIQEIKDGNIVEGLQDKQSNNSDDVKEVGEMQCKSRRHYEILENTTFASESRKNRDDKEASTSRETLEGECSNTKDNGDKIEETHGNEEVSYDVRHMNEMKEDHEGEEKSEGNEVRGTSDDQNELERSDRKCSMFFAPCFFIGGAFIASLVVFVCSFVRLKRR